MFRKLVSNLPFNPSLITQVSFYAKRMHAEESVRRIGVGMVSLALVLQIFAVVSPPEPTLARVGNDLIPGGATSQGELVNHCNTNSYDFATILSHFQINCYDLYFGSVQTINSNTTDYGDRLYSMGRAPYQKPGETSVNIPGLGTFYMRPLDSWGNANYRAIVGNRANGAPFMVLFDCGNLVIVGPPEVPPPVSEPEKVITCSDLDISVNSVTKVTVGTPISVLGHASGQNIPPGDLVDMYYTFANADTDTLLGLQEAKGVQFNGTKASDTTRRAFTVDKPGHFRFALAVKYDSSSKEASGNNTGACIRDVYVETPPPEPEKVIVCTALISSFGNGQKIVTGESVTVRGQATGSNLPEGELVDMYYDYTDSSGTVIDSQEAKGIGFNGTVAEDNVSRNFTLDKAGTYTFRLAVKYESSNKDATGNRTGSCAKKITVEEPCLEEKEDQDDTKCLILSKKASNETQDIKDANDTIAKAGDTIVYTISTKNTSKNTVIEKYVIEENLIDIMQYAEIVNLSGGKKDKYGIATWPAIDIKPGETISKKIIVKIKNPIPQTPISVSDPGSYDMKMTNIYGNTINIKLPPTTIKTTEYVTKQLPNTGPGESLAVGFVILSIAGYFFMRSRLIAKEVDIIRTEFATSGGA